MLMQSLRSIKIHPFLFPRRSCHPSNYRDLWPFLGSAPSSRLDCWNGAALRVPFLTRHRSSSSLSVVEEAIFVNGSEQIQLLKAVEDLHGGVIVEMEGPMDAEAFVPSLRASMSHWRQLGKKGIWIKLPIELANLIASAVKEGFTYHHAEPNYLMLVSWLPKSMSTLPPNASHRVGVGAFVMNDKRELLVVQEKNGKFKGIGLWKLPTGVVDEGEEIHEAAVREVKEETGIETEFVEVLAFRQTHESFFGKSDIFFVCMLQPRSSHIQKQHLEIEAAQWMPIEEYAAQPFVMKNEQFKNVAEICRARIYSNYFGFAPMRTTTGSGKLTYLFCNKDNLCSDVGLDYLPRNV